MEISMSDGRVMMSIGSIKVPLTVLPLGQWSDGEDVINHPALRAWERDCNRKFVTEED